MLVYRKINCEVKEGFGDNFYVDSFLENSINEKLVNKNLVKKIELFINNVKKLNIDIFGLVVN